MYTIKILNTFLFKKITMLIHFLNKNDNIHKRDAQKSYDKKNIDKYRVAVNITA